MTDIQMLKQIIEQAKNIVFFGGAGVSTESGIPDFRGSNGLYTEPDDLRVPPEKILSIGYFNEYPREFYRYYKKNMIYPNAEPNAAHIALARLEKEGKLSAVVTQNIDGLHQKAGSQNVMELHGSCLRNYCVKCGKKYDLDYVLQSDGLPLCTCGGIVRPDVVLYGEGLDGYTWTCAENAIYNADVLIVGGTSLTVYPAASIVDNYRGEHLVIINKSTTPYDRYAQLVIREPIGETLKRVFDD